MKLTALAIVLWLMVAGAASAPQRSVALSRDEPSFEVSLVTFPSPVQNADPPNGTVYVEYYSPKRAGRMPAVILLHHWAVRKPTIERQFAAALAENGIVTAMLVLPYHLQRTPPGFKSGMAMIGSDVPRMVRSIQQTVLEIRALVQWLKERPEVDPKRIGLAGISLGAMVGTLALGQTDQFDAAALILGGADVADILRESPVTLRIRPALRRQGYTQESLTRDLAPVEPLGYLTPAQGRVVLMVNATQDPVIPRRDTLALWEALGRPPIVWVESGHYIPWGRPQVNRLVTDFFLYRFGERPAFRAPSRIRLRRVKLGFLLDRAPLLGVGGAVELLKPPSDALSLDLNLTTGGVGIGAGVNLGSHLTIGAQRKLFSGEHEVLPYAMVHVTL